MATILVIFAVAIGLAAFAIKLKVLSIVLDAYGELLSQFPLPRWMRIVLVLTLVALLTGVYLRWLQTGRG